MPDRINCMTVDQQVNSLCFAEALKRISDCPALDLKIVLLTQQRVLRSRQGTGCGISGHATRCTPLPLGQNDRGEGKASNLQTSGYGPRCCLPAAWAGSVGCHDLDATAGSVRWRRRPLPTTTAAKALQQRLLSKGAFAEDRSNSAK